MAPTFKFCRGTVQVAVSLSTHPSGYGLAWTDPYKREDGGERSEEWGRLDLIQKKFKLVRIRQW